jgi:hypothetical protein
MVICNIYEHFFNCYSYFFSLLFIFKLNIDIFFVLYLHIFYYATYNNKKAIIKANKPVASANANPNIA